MAMIVIYYMKFTALVPLLITIYSTKCCGQDVNRVATWVSRRSFDLYRQRGDKSHIVCGDPTFLVEERECTKNENIVNSNDINLCRHHYHQCVCFTGCSLALIKNNHESIPLVDVHLSKGLMLVHRNQLKNINTSWCQIISLEVYRGSNKSIEVNHSGFILTDNSIFEVKLLQYKLMNA